MAHIKLILNIIANIFVETSITPCTFPHKNHGHFSRCLPVCFHGNLCYTEPPEDGSSQSSQSSSLSSTSTASGSQSTADAGSFSSITQSSSTDTNGHEVVPSSQQSCSMLDTYKLVGDNLDKHVTPREMRLDHQAQSLHYFNCYAVKDRVSTLGLKDNPSLPDFSAFSEAKILPTAEDHESLMSNFVILVSRVVKKHFPFSYIFLKVRDRRSEAHQAWVLSGDGQKIRNSKCKYWIVSLSIYRVILL